VSRPDALVDVRRRLHQRLIGRVDARQLDAMPRAERRVRVREEALSLVREQGHMLPQSALAEVVNAVSDAVVGMGPIEFLLKDPDVTEVMVNGPDDVYVERKGRIEKVADRLFEGEEAVLHVIERIVAPLGLRVDATSPWVDARLPDGLRVHAIVPPLSLCGPVLNVRKFSSVPIGPGDLLRTQSLGVRMLEFLAACVRARMNIVISGGTSSGKTTLLGVLSSFVSRHERVITIEDAAELRLAQPHVIGLEARPATVEGRGEVTVRDLVRNALRMRPDRIVVGEVRGGEALDMLQAMNTGPAVRFPRRTRTPHDTRSGGWRRWRSCRTWIFRSLTFARRSPPPSTSWCTRRGSATDAGSCSRSPVWTIWTARASPS
jgi:pilus assembly protein CpaF